MNNLEPKKIRHVVLVLCLFLLFSIIGLWSWNTLAELFNGPVAQYKHVVAAFGLLIVLKTALFHSHRHLTTQCSHSAT
jgi:hypothetical protein